MLNDDFKKTIDLCFERLDYGEAKQMPVEVLFSAGQILKNTVKNLEIQQAAQKFMEILERDFVIEENFEI